MIAALSDEQLRILEAVGPQGAFREALGELVTTADFVELINLHLVVNRLVGARIVEAPDTRTNAWQLTDAGTELLRKDEPAAAPAPLR